MRARCTVLPVFLITVACGGGSGKSSSPTSPTATATPPPPAPGFLLAVENTTLSAPRGCAQTVLTVSAEPGFTGTVSYECAGQPAGLRCGFGGQPNLTAGSTVRTGMTVNADPTVPSGTHRFELRSRSGSITRNANLEISVGHAVAPPVSGALTVTGCAGTIEGNPLTGGVQRYIGGIFVISFANNDGSRDNDRTGFCVQTEAASDGSFVLVIPSTCPIIVRFQENQPVYLQTGAGQTCVSTPFRAGGTAHVDLLGRSPRAPCQ